ncbi:unnamed protein product [Moneuplotes crassus]|uniref:Uncharacterized protein n=1 Tax=Euplotes crassus TaxID=5936 RepID=A0AAD2D4A6_EUPCR|nr:unnamed protein product [Moneuplotes crassus]
MFLLCSTQSRFQNFIDISVQGYPHSWDWRNINSIRVQDSLYVRTFVRILQNNLCHIFGRVKSQQFFMNEM